ncbi:MAG: MATE family efflux transporter, partial [Pseudomonadota bacterium]
DPALIGAVAVGAILFDIVFAAFNFLRSGTTGLVAQALGADNQVEVRASLVRALIIAVVAGLLMVGLQGPLTTLGLKGMGTSAAVGEATATYLTIRFYAVPFGLANYAILGWFLGLGKAGTGLFLQVFLNTLNMTLNVILVLVFDWGIAGVAWGTAIGECATALVGLALIFHQTGARDWPSRRVIGDWSQFKRLAALNGDIMIRSVALLFVYFFFTAQSARADDVTLAANAVLMHFFHLASYFLDGFATAAEQLAGRAVGARYRPAFDKTVLATLTFGGLVSIVLAAGFWMAGPFFIDLMTASEPVRETARIYLPWAVLTPLAAVLAFQMDGIFIGATWSRDMRNMMLVSITIYLAAWWVLIEPFGVHGLWMALLIFLAARGVTLALMCPGRARRTFRNGAVTNQEKSRPDPS